MVGNRRRSKLLKAVAALGLAVVGALISRRGDFRDEQMRLEAILPAAVGSATILLAGLASVRAGTAWVRDGAIARVGETKGNFVAKAAYIAGTLIVILWTLGAAGIHLQNLLLGGALTGVVLGIAAQQTLGNIFAGIVLVVVKPFNVGDQTVIKTTLGEYEGRVAAIGFFYVSMETANGPVDIPNAAALASAVGPGARSTPKKPEESAEPAAEEGGAG
ncbi:MAG: mechanosensitive ion channel domain-containing protein [Actinomycetota bacterium]